MASARYAVLLTNLLLSALQSVQAGRPYKEYDEYILCFGKARSDFTGWPAGFSAAQYTDAMAFCSAVYGVPNRNLGCWCPAPHVAPICSLQNGANPTLFSSYFGIADAYGSISRVSMLDFCLERCECYDNDTADDYHTENATQQASSQAQPDRNPGAAVGADTPPSINAPPLGSSLANASGFGLDPTSFNTYLDVDQCGQSCKVGDSCPGHNCLCQVKSAKYEPGAGLVEYLAACTLYVSGKKAREESPPCPCNETYVSHACCDARQGMVWEAPHLKLGELVKDDL
ncbi:MAG: hypothetical protein M1828_002102 [Chrysothrix sp. TS-e1954]|nr:MAG: hypothetical protein M1828_002102 [Chrysothrix sp. TS-e1954]